MLRHLLLLLLFIPSCDRSIAVTKTAEQSAHAESSTNLVTHNKTLVDPAALIHPLIDPTKLATLGDRGANTRIQKIAAILWQAKVDGQNPAKVTDRAVELIGWGGTE